MGGLVQDVLAVHRRMAPWNKVHCRGMGFAFSPMCACCQSCTRSAIDLVAIMCCCGHVSAVECIAPSVDVLRATQAAWRMCRTQDEITRASQVERDKLRKMIIELVLGTDMKQHLRWGRLFTPFPASVRVHSVCLSVSKGWQHV